MTEAVRFWALIELIGLGAAPLAGVLLARVPGAGLGLGKVLGLLLVTWLVWLGGSTTLVAYGVGSAAGWVALVCAFGLLAWVRGWEGRRAVARGEPRGWFARRRWRRLAARVPEPDPLRTRLFWGAEAVFGVAFVAMCLLVAYSPDVWNTEKPMDMAFVNASNQATTFPPHDPWLAGADLNYYYLGQLAIGVIVKLTDVAPDRGYNVAVAALFALTAAAVFTVAGTLWAAIRGARGAVWAGIGGVVLMLVAGNLEGTRLLIADGGPLRDYDWFAASRVIPDTINEFPWFSFLLGDLHAHVLALPFTLLAIAFVLQVVLDGPRLAGRGRALIEGAAAALAIGFLYTVNSWSYPIVAGLLVGAVLAWIRDPRSESARPAAVRWLLIVLAGSVLLVLPFHLSFEPAASGIGLVKEGRGFAGWLGDEFVIYGSLAGLVALAYAGRLAASRRPGRNLAWIVVGAIVAGSLLAALDYAHVALLTVALFVSLLALFAADTPPAARAVWLLVAGGVACLLGPELLYIRDEFDGSALYRMNTVFKLGYQAWVLLGLAAVGAWAYRAEWLPRRGVRWLLVAGRRAARRGRARLPGRRDVRPQGRLRPLADARRARLAARPRARRPRRDRLPARACGRRRRRAGVGRRRLLGVRPRAHLDVHGPPDGAGLAGPRAPVGPRRGQPAGRRRAHVRVGLGAGGRRPAAPLRRPLGRRRTARAHRPRRRRRRQVGPARAARLRPRRDDRLAARRLSAQAPWRT